MEKHWEIKIKERGREDRERMERWNSIGRLRKKSQEGKRGDNGKIEKHWEIMKKVPGREEERGWKDGKALEDYEKSARKGRGERMERWKSIGRL